MFGKTFKIGKLFGFQLELSWTFLLIALLLAVFYGPLVGIALLIVLFGSVLLHELGHALMARRLGVQIAGIELNFFGGVAKMVSAFNSARDEILVSLAGPLVSLFIGAAAVVMSNLTGSQNLLLKLIAVINVIMGVFNLIPAIPMDGGRVFRAALSRWMGQTKATRVAVTVSKVFSVMLAIYALVTQQWFLIALSALLWFMAEQERRMIGHWGYSEFRKDSFRKGFD